MNHKALLQVLYHVDEPLHHDPDFMQIYTIVTYISPFPDQLPGVDLMTGDAIVRKISKGGESTSGKELAFVFYICLTSFYI